MKYEMTTEQLDKILAACKPVPLIALQCGTPASAQERANAAWAALGEEMGFNHMTVRPASGGDRFFVPGSTRTASPGSAASIPIWIVG